jgi:hypothetical protein
MGPWGQIRHDLSSFTPTSPDLELRPLDQLCHAQIHRLGEERETADLTDGYRYSEKGDASDLTQMGFFHTTWAPVI